MNISQIIKELADTGKPLVNTRLTELSELTPADLPLFKSTWRQMDVNRRRQVISRLAELVRDNVELNFAPVFKYALSDLDADVRVGAIDGLWENEDPGLIKTFINLLMYDASADVQTSAATALGKFSTLAECEEIRSDYKAELSQALLAAIDDAGKPVEVKRRALEAVSPLSLPAVKEAIRKAYDSRDERLVVSAIYCMGKTCDNAWLPVLYKELENADTEIRYEAAGALGEIGMEDSVSRLLEHAHDSDIEVRLAAIQAVAKIGGKEAKHGLESLARDPNQAIREAVEQGLSEIETKENMTLFEMDTPGENDERRD
ncbi:MAG: HEAT repeat domain-containing protein [Dehalococcoidia bacterium]|nr:HEAT repeat domain-containing protein [Dehalococcoidia bacterium]